MQPQSPPMDTKQGYGVRAAAMLLALLTVTLTNGGPAVAQECRTNYYGCDLNRNGRIDPSNPGCCWSPAAGRPSQRSCPPNFYKCDLNRNGRVDPDHPGCCWNLR